MLTRLAPLALVLVAACHAEPIEHETASAPAPKQCLLIGTWERRLPIQGSDALVLPSSSPTPIESLFRTETFHADGRWTAIAEGSLFCGNFPREPSVRNDRVAFWPIVQAVELRGEWQLVASDPRHVEVYIRCRARDQDSGAMDEARSIGEGATVFTVNSHDELTTTTRDRQARMVRVKDAK